MRTRQVLAKLGFVAIVALLGGVTFGEMTEPAIAQAGCANSQCFAGWNGEGEDYYCAADILNTNCEFGIDVCYTEECEGGDGGGQCGGRICQE